MYDAPTESTILNTSSMKASASAGTVNITA